MDFHLIELEEVDSTNLYASRLLQKQPVREGTVISAVSQTAGKGQGGNSWLSEPGKNLTFTLIWNPRFIPADQQFLLSQAVALGVSDFLSLFTDEVSVKWPNDIQIQGRKAAGILIQHTVQGEWLENTIAGIGINMNQIVFPASLPNPVSLAEILKRPVDLRESLMQVLACLDQRYGQLRSREHEVIRQDYLRMLQGFGEEQLFMVDGRRVPGVITGTDSFGRLLVKHSGDGVIAYSHGEIGWSVVPFTEGEAQIDG